MKELTALDVFYMLKEFKELEGAKVDQVYVPSDVIIRLHVPNKGKTHLRISSKFMFLTDFKEEQSSPGGFCMALRKWLSGARVEAVDQAGFERVIRFVFKNLDMYIELFGKGNIILVKDGVVLASKNKIGKTYAPPIREVDARSLKKATFNKLLESEDKIVLVLARELGLGGVYAKWVLEEFDSQQPAKQFKSKEIEKIFEKVQSLFKQKIEPSSYKEHILPFAGGTPLNKETYNDAIAEYALIQLKEDEMQRKNASYLSKKEKLEKIIEVQNKSIKEHEKTILDSSKKGELIYENYALVLEAIAAGKKNLPHKSIKKVTGRKITLDL